MMRCDAVRAFVQRREYLTWPEDPQDLDWFYERLTSRLLRDTKGKKSVEDKQQPLNQPADSIQLQNISVHDL